MPVYKSIKYGSSFISVSSDTLAPLNALYATRTYGLLFKDDSLSFLQYTPERLYNTAPYVIDTSAELSAVQAAATTGYIVNMNTAEVYTYSGGTWVLSTDNTLYLTLIKPGRLYRNTVTKFTFYADATQTLFKMLGVDRGMATQTDVTNGTGTQWVSPLTLANAHGSW